MWTALDKAGGGGSPKLTFFVDVIYVWSLSGTLLVLTFSVLTTQKQVEEVSALRVLEQSFLFKYALMRRGSVYIDVL